MEDTEVCSTSLSDQGDTKDMDSQKTLQGSVPLRLVLQNAFLSIKTLLEVR